MIDYTVIDCPKCEGRGYPDIGDDGTFWDEETRERLVYVCPSCSGSGQRRVWDDER